MKKILTLLTIIFSTILLSSCGNKSEEEKIMDDLDLEIEEFLEENPEATLDNSGDEKDEVEVEIIEEKAEETAEKPETVEIKKTEETGNIEIVKTVEEFATCITKNGAKAYGTSWCSHCQKQKEMFGDEAAKNLAFMDCEADIKGCKDAGITGYPSWKVGGNLYPGVQSFEKLGELTNCKLELGK